MSRFRFRYLQPTLFSGLLDDPVLYLNLRPSGKALMIDCGQIQHLAKRVLRSVDALFISHAHMDHFMGIDTFIRNNHVAPRAIDIYGPPGIAGKTAMKLAGYDWNLAEASWCTLRLHEIFPDRLENFVLSGGDRFSCRGTGNSSRTDRTVHSNQYITVQAEECDHNIPSLIYRVSERPSFSIDEAKLEKAGLVRGEWLRVLSRRFGRGMTAQEPLAVLQRRGERVETEEVTDVGALYESIRSRRRPAAIGYVTDIGFSSDNVAKVLSLMEGVTLLLCECSFLVAEREKARVSRHLCTADLNWLMDRLRPSFILPMHLSKSYSMNVQALYEELECPEGVTIIRLPEHVAPRPLLACDVPP